jgi:hypothetical protein
MLWAARILPILLIPAWLVACQVMPEEVNGYQDNCILMNAELIPPQSSDPHLGYKNVYACNVDVATLTDPAFSTYPEGTMIVKESTRDGQNYPWLIATAKKVDSEWQWAEYKRNFPNEDFVKILAGQGVCTGCHKDAKDTGDWLFTHYEGP